MTDKMELLKRTKLFVLDMDGTFYLGNQILPGAADFLKAVEKAGKQYLFFTNNSSRSPRDYMAKLEKMGCPITRDQIMTSGDVTIRYLQTHYPDKTVYLVGTPPLVESFQEAGIHLVNEKPDIVVIGFDTTLTYEKLSNACTFIREGALFLATHLDINCPTETGFIPDCGAICNMITETTDKKPIYLGKPSKEVVDLCVKASGFRKEAAQVPGEALCRNRGDGAGQDRLFRPGSGLCGRPPVYRCGYRREKRSRRSAGADRGDTSGRCADFRGAAGCHLCLTGRDGPAALSIVKSAYNLRWI